MKLYILFTLLFIHSVQTADLPKLDISEDNGKYGFKSNGEWTIAPKYRSATQFSMLGYSLTKDDFKSEIINKDGTVLTQFDNIKQINPYIAIVSLKMKKFLFDFRKLKKISKDFIDIEYIGEGKFKAIRDSIPISEANLFLIQLNSEYKIVDGWVFTIQENKRFYSLLDSNGHEKVLRLSRN